MALCFQSCYRVSFPKVGIEQVAGRVGTAHHQNSRWPLMTYNPKSHRYIRSIRDQCQKPMMVFTKMGFPQFRWAVPTLHAEDTHIKCSSGTIAKVCISGGSDRNPTVGCALPPNQAGRPVFLSQPLTGSWSCAYFRVSTLLFCVYLTCLHPTS